jgi:hypothetical protein
VNVTQEESSDSLKSHELKLLNKFLIESKSIKVDLVPGSNTNLADRNFTWAIASYENGQMTFDFTFDNPQYISSDEDNVDVFIVQFFNTSLYM